MLTVADELRVVHVDGAANVTHGLTPFVCFHLSLCKGGFVQFVPRAGLLKVEFHFCIKRSIKERFRMYFIQYILCSARSVVISGCVVP